MSLFIAEAKPENGSYSCFSFQHRKRTAKQETLDDRSANRIDFCSMYALLKGQMGSSFKFQGESQNFAPRLA